ncbi:MAG TPA: hypothetical protein VH256_03560, partial [Thermoleophilaceae bacterium]|nr:hypothetical protein [Thermoleophilaceae bacterium]
MSVPDVHFRERMCGSVSFDYRDYNTALAARRGRRFKCSCKVDVRIDDIDEFLCATPHVAQLSGVVNCPALGGEMTG